jgi:hemerythrin superfamily protein
MPNTRARGAPSYTEHHQRLERQLAELAAVSREGDPAALRASWSRFERELDDHLRAEEEIILPRLAAADGDEAQAIRREHEQLRRRAAELGVGVDLRLVRPEIIDKLIAQLRAHAAREERGMYTWAKEDAMDAPQSHEHKPFDELKTMLDEVRVKLHLAGMDAKDAFHDISRDAEKLASQAGRASEAAAKKLLERLRAVADSIVDGE